MIDVASFPAVARAGVLIGAVLVEAIVLYVGYGALTSALGPSMKRVLAGD